MGKNAFLASVITTTSESMFPYTGRLAQMKRCRALPLLLIDIWTAFDTRLSPCDPRICSAEIWVLLTWLAGYRPVQTRIGNGNMLMGSCHVAHDVVMGSNNVVGNNSLVRTQRNGFAPCLHTVCFVGFGFTPRDGLSHNF